MQNAVTHIDRTDKDRITAAWTAPPAGSGPVRIGYVLSFRLWDGGRGKL